MFDNKYEAAFKKLRYKLIHTPILAHFLYKLEIKIETNASNKVIAGAFFQKHGEE